MPTQYVLFQVANEHGSIRSKDGLTHIRVLGVYRSKKYALNLAKGLDVETRIAPTESFVILLNKKQPHVDDEKAHFERLMYAYTDSQRQTQTDRETRAAERTCPETIPVLHDDDDDDANDNIHTNDDNIHTDSSLSLERDGHTVCVLALVPDVFHWQKTKQLHENYLAESDAEFSKSNAAGTTTDTDINTDEQRELFFAKFMKGKKTVVPGDQPLVDFLGAFETESDAKAFLDDYKDLKEFPRACIRMRKWIRVCDVHTVDVQRYYDDARLQKFMDALRAAKVKKD